MKYYKILTILVLGAVFSFYGCKNDTTKKEEPQPFKPAPLNTSNTAEPSQNAGGVWHYTCNNGCAGGAGAAGNCATCGEALAHNQAYHNNANSNPTTNPFNPQPTATAGRNAAGVWHYTCGNGCAGGAGAAGNCSNCGEALAHNQAYH